MTSGGSSVKTRLPVVTISFRRSAEYPTMHGSTRPRWVRGCPWNILVQCAWLSAYLGVNGAWPLGHKKKGKLRYYVRVILEFPAGWRALWACIIPALTMTAHSSPSPAKLLIKITIKITYPWAVYCEGPPSFIWGGGVSQKDGTVIPVYNSHTHSKRSNKLRRLALCAFIWILND